MTPQLHLVGREWANMNYFVRDIDRLPSFKAQYLNRTDLHIRVSNGNQSAFKVSWLSLFELSLRFEMSFELGWTWNILVPHILLCWLRLDATLDQLTGGWTYCQLTGKEWYLLKHC